MHNLTFEQTPFSYDKTFSVHKLSSQGVNQYLSKDSYLRMPLQKKSTNEISGLKHESDNKMKENLLEERQIRNRNLKSNDSKINKINDKTSIFEGKNQVFESSNKTFSAQKTNDSELVNKIISFFNKKKKHNRIKLNKEEIRQNNDYTLLKPFNYNTKINFSELICENTKSPARKNFVSCPKKEDNDKLLTNVKKSECIEKYEDSGITYFKIPHIKNLKKSNSEKEYRGLQLSNNLLKTIQMWKNNKPYKENIENLCIEENEKIKKIISNQINSEFISQSKLPKISVIINKPTTVIYKNNIPNNKILSEKYNPYVNAPNPSKSFSKRNPFGAIFNN